MSDSEPPPGQARSAILHQSQIPPAFAWLLRMARCPVERRQAQDVICRLAMAEARIEALKRTIRKREAAGWAPQWKREVED